MYYRRNSIDRTVRIDSTTFPFRSLCSRYRLWLDEVSQLFGGLDLCAIELVQAKDGSEYIIQVNDCTMQLIGEDQEVDHQRIADLIVHKMEIHCRPNEQMTILR